MTCTIDYLEDKILNNSLLNNSFDDFISYYLDSLKYENQADDKSKNIRLIVRSANVPLVHSILSRANDFRELNVNIKAIFTHLTPLSCIEKWTEEICLCDCKIIQDSVRWAKNQALHDAHEQLIMGNKMYWCGDSMKRAAESRSITSHFEKDSPESVKLAIQAFTAMWNCSISLTRKSIQRLSVNRNDIQPKNHDHVLENWASNFHHVITTRH